MVAIEVAQITLTNWAIRDDTNTDIYLDVYYERKKRSCGCCGQNRRRQIRDRTLSMRTTDKVCESCEMRWRKYNEDNFLVGLFRFEGKTTKSLRNRQVITVVANVRRVLRGAKLLPGESGELVEVMKGQLVLGTWGLLTLKPVDRQGPELSQDEADLPVVLMELRPRTMRPFMLEFAKPRFVSKGDTEDGLGRRKRLSLTSQDSYLTFSGSSSASRSFQSQSGKRSPRAPSGVQRQNPGNLAIFSPKSSEGDQKSSSFRRGWDLLYRGDRRGKADPSEDDERGPSAFGHPCSESSQSSLNEDKLVKRVTDAMSSTQSLGIFRKSVVIGGVRTKDGGPGREIVRQQMRNLTNKRRKDAPKEYVQWTPVDWEAFWRSCWPQDDDLLGSGHDVVPLMEAEFRKDCVIFFNTLFPRHKCQMFQTLKRSAFDPGGSKVSFKLVSNMRQGSDHSPTRAGYLEMNSSGDALDDGQRNMDDSGLGYRLKEATRTLQRKISRSKSSLATTAASPDSDSGTRSRTSVFARLFQKTDPRLPSSPKASSPSSSRPICRDEDVGGTGSQNLSGVFEDEGVLVSTGVNSTGLGSVGLNSVGLASGGMSSAGVVPTSEDKRRSGSMDWGIAGKQQPCMCTVATPKGVFVDEYTPRIMLLKRFLICFATCGVNYTEVSNCSELAKLWPYPLASVLGHGSRILIRLEDVDPSEFMNFLLFGDPLCVDWKDNGVPYPLNRRLAATHSVQLDADTGNLNERKLQVMSASDTMQNISDGIRRKHLGLNLPIGGVGNPSPMGKEHFIDFTGRVVQRVSPTRTSSSLFSLRAAKLDSDRPEDEFQPPSRSRGSVISQASLNWQEEPPVRPRRISMLSARSGSLLSRNSPGEGEEGRGSMGSAYFAARQAKQRKKQMRVLDKIQGGHLYIRIDDFGEQIGRSGDAAGGGAFGRRSEMRRTLLKKPRGYNLIYEQAKLQSRLNTGCMDCGELFFSNSVPLIRRTRVARMHRDRCGDMTLLRMCSEPSLDTKVFSATDKDIEWVKEAIETTSKWPLRVPPSPLALRLALDHFDPTSVQLYGQGGFKSVEDFWNELNGQRSFIMRNGQGFHRYVEPLVLQLRWKGYTLMCTHEVYQDSTGVWRTVPKYSFISVAMRPDEYWESAVDTVLASEFQVTASTLHSFLSDSSEEDTHRILEESLDSPSYPGMNSFYRAHMVVWDLKDSAANILSSMGLPFDTAARNEQYQREEKVSCDFSTKRGVRKRFYSWVPELMARERQGFLNMDTQTACDRWAKYAFESQGVVQYPPSEQALTKLLKRCGVDTSAFGRDGRRSIGYFWMELLNQESYLMMNAGQPHRIVESLFVKVRWRQSRRAASKSTLQSGNAGADSWVVLVKQMIETTRRDSILTEGGFDMTQQPTDGSGVAYSFLNARKFREETWEDCMMRCVMKELDLTRQQLKSVYERPVDEEGRYAFHDLVRQSKSFPGIVTLYRTHLVTINLKEDYASVLGPAAFKTQDELPNANRRGSCNLPAPPIVEIRSPRKTMSIGASWELRRIARGNSGDGSISPTRSRMLDSSRKSESFTDVLRGSRGGEEGHKHTFLWVYEDDSGPISLEVVVGAGLWAEARKREEKHKVASLLIGLEGTAPQRKSPFGVEHDASGASAKVSATGGRKWRAYRINNALQIPSDHGGMHLKITRAMFQEFMDTCELLNLGDPAEDFVDDDVVYSRDDLHRRYAEKEMFRHILGGNCRQGNEAIELMKEYYSQLRTPTQAYNSICKSQACANPQEPVAIQARVTVAPESGDIIDL